MWLVESHGLLTFELIVALSLIFHVDVCLDPQLVQGFKSRLAA